MGVKTFFCVLSSFDNLCKLIVGFADVEALEDLQSAYRLLLMTLLFHRLH